MAVLEEEVRRQRVQDALLESAGGYGPDDTPMEPVVAESVTDSAPEDKPIPKHVEEHYGDWNKWPTVEPMTAESVIAKPDDQSPKYETKSAEYVGTGDDWRKWPTIAEDQTGAPSPVTYPKIAQDQTGAPVAAQSADQPAPDTLSQVERATLVKPPQAPTEPAPDTLKQVERAQLVKLPDNIPRGTITTPVEPITPQAPTQAPPQVKRGELVSLPPAAPEPLPPPRTRQLPSTTIESPPPPEPRQLLPGALSEPPQVPAPQPTGPKAPGASTQLAPPGKMDLRPDEVPPAQAPTTQAPATQPAVKPVADDWRTWITADGTQAELPGAAPTEKVAPTELKAGEGNRVGAGALYSYLASKFADSGLVGYVPPDGARWGITTGSAAEWAAFGLAVAKQESDLNTRSYNASDPGGSVGLFQFGQGQTQFTDGRDQFDPQASADAFVKSVQHYVGNQGNVSNLGATFGSIRRPNEAGQYIGYAQDVAAKNGGSTAAAQPAKQAWESWATLAPAEQTAAETAGLTRQRNALDDLNRKTENPGQFYKSLDQPIAGVTDANRKAYQENFKQELTKYAQNFYGEPDPDKAFQRAIGDANLGTFLQDTGRSMLGTAGQFDVGLNKAAKDIDFNRLDQFAKVIHPESDGPGRAAFIKTITSIADPTVRAQTIGKIIADLEPAKQAALNSVDIADSADRVASPEYQAAQTQAIALKDAWVQKQLEADPTLKGTPGQWWSGQIGSFLTNAAVSTAAAPFRIGAFIAQLYGQNRDRIKADHPDLTDDQVGTEAAKTSFLQQLPQEVLMAALQGKMGPLAAWIGKVKNPVVRFGLGGGTHLATGAAAGALQQVGANVGENKPPLENVPQAALGGAVQAAPFAIHGGIHGVTARETPVVQAPENVPETQAETPPAQPQPVTAQSVLGPDVPDTSVPWYQPGPIITRPEERTTFTPAELTQKVAEALDAGSPEQIRQAMANLYPDDKAYQQGVFFNQPTVEEQNIPLGTNPPPRPGNVGESEPWISREANKTTASGVANKYVAQRVASGELPPIDPNVGVTTEELLVRGTRMGPEEVNQHVSDLMSNKGGNLRDQAAAVRAEEARLTQRARHLSFQSERNPGNGQLRIDAQNAYKDVSDFLSGPVRKIKDAFHVAGMGLQGEPEIDLSTYNGLREKFLKEVGQDAPPSAEPKMRKMADQVRKAHAAEYDAMTKLGNEIERQTARRKLPTAEEVRLKAMEIMKVMPCPT
jgi:hypothetical protein